MNVSVFNPAVIQLRGQEPVFRRGHFRQIAEKREKRGNGQTVQRFVCGIRQNPIEIRRIVFAPHPENADRKLAPFDRRIQNINEIQFFRGRSTETAGHDERIGIQIRRFVDRAEQEKLAEITRFALQPGNNCNLHLFRASRVALRIARFLSEIGQSGRRYSSSIMPIIAIAAFTGIGLDSMKRCLNRL